MLKRNMYYFDLPASTETVVPILSIIFGNSSEQISLNIEKLRKHKIIEIGISEQISHCKTDAKFIGTLVSGARKLSYKISENC